MSEHTIDENTQSLQEQIVLEEKKYIDALKADAEFHVVKSIRQRINKLKAALGWTKETTKTDLEDSGQSN